MTTTPTAAMRERPTRPQRQGEGEERVLTKVLVLLVSTLDSFMGKLGQWQEPWASCPCWHQSAWKPPRSTEDLVEALRRLTPEAATAHGEDDEKCGAEPQGAPLAGGPKGSHLRWKPEACQQQGERPRRAAAAPVWPAAEQQASSQPSRPNSSEAS